MSLSPAGLRPFTQCDLLMDSPGHMQSWGGIKSFELVLRKCKMQRTQGNCQLRRTCDEDDLSILHIVEQSKTFEIIARYCSKDCQKVLASP